MAVNLMASAERSRMVLLRILPFSPWPNPTARWKLEISQLSRVKFLQSRNRMA